MIPVRLVIEGLYSYQERAEIDFSRLTEGRLFGIFGSVGSGKSALLEAITFALYSETERMGSSGRNYNMMNLRSSKLFIGFEFLAGEGQERYKFEVKGARNSNHFEKVNTYKRVGYKWSGSEWVPLESNNAARILKLSYQNFTKTVIIPQGKFQEFLHLTAKPRTAMLQEIFELQRFDLYEPTKRLIGENQQALSRLEGSLNEVPEVADEELKEKKGIYQDRQDSLAKLKKRQEDLKQQDLEMTEVKKVQDHLKEVRTILDLLEPDEAEFIEKEKRLKRYIQVKNAFDESLRRQQSFLANQKDLKEIQQILEGEKEPLSKEIEKLEEDFATTSEAYEGRETLRNKAREMRTISEMVGLEEEWRVLAERMEAGKGVVLQHQEEKDLLKEGIEASELKIAKLQEDLPDGSLLLGLRGWFDQLTFKKSAVTEAELEISRVKEKNEGEKAARLKWINQPLVQSVAAESARSLEAISENIELYFEEHEKLIAQFSKQGQDLQFQSGLSSFAKALEPGAPCPLCGAKDHPAPFHSEEAASQLEEINARIDALRGHSRKVNEMKTELHGWQLREQQGVEMMAQANSVLMGRKEALESHRSNFSWVEFDPEKPDQVNQLIEKEKSLKQQIKEVEHSLREQRNKVEHKQAELERFQRALNDMVLKSSGIQTRIDTLKDTLKEFEYITYKEKTPGERGDLARQYDEQYETISTAYQSVKSTLETKRSKFLELSKNIEFGSREIRRVEGELKILAQSLNEKIRVNRLVDLDEARKILELDIDLEKEEEEISRFQERLVRARTEWETFKKQDTGKVYDLDQHEKVKAEIEEGKGQGSHLEQEIARLQYEIKEMQGRIDKRKALMEEQGDLLSRAENLKVMIGLFRGSGFVNYVSTIYLRELCQRANIRFQQLTRHQLSLEIDAENEFQVRDNLNGGKVRSVRTLSGGQTFQASLCLALALADNITHRMGSTQNFFFLDEGFGTLDRDSLALVFETLKQLRKENRIVGVISHVEELQQEIDHSLLVRKDDERGSLVQGSWE